MSDILHMVDRCGVPTAAEAKALRAANISVYAGYFGGITSACPATLAELQTVQPNGLKLLPIYVGQNASDAKNSGKWPCVLTADQGKRDANDAMRKLEPLTKNGPVCHDIEYGTYIFSPQNTLLYANAFANEIRPQYKPVLYEPLAMAHDVNNTIDAVPFVAAWTGTDFPVNPPINPVNGEWAWQWSDNFQCAGSRWDASSITASVFNTNPNEMVFPNGFKLRAGFLAYWQSNGGLQAFGMPISWEYQLSSSPLVRRQWFERAILTWSPGSNPAAFDVQGELLGDMLRDMSYQPLLSEHILYAGAFVVANDPG